MKKDLKIEQFWLHVSLWFNVACIFLNGAVGIHTDSSAVTFDAIYCVICTFTYFLLTIYSKKIDDPASEHFQFGYNKLEPILIVTQTLLIIFSCIYAFISSARDIVHGHVIKNFMEVAVLESFLAIGCLMICWGCYYNAKKYKNNILEVQAITWVLDFIQSVLIAAGFFIGYFVLGTQYAWIVPYIDPIAMLCLACTVIRQPAQIFYLNFLDLLDGSADRKHEKEIKQIIQKISIEKAPHFKVHSVLTRKAGKRIFIIVMCEKTSHISLEDMSKLKERMLKELSSDFFEVDLKFAV